MDPEAQRAEERASRIAELERRLEGPRPVGVRAPIALLCMAGALVLGWMDREDIAYFFSSAEPVTLGTEGAYRLEAIAPNRYVQLHGIPTHRGYHLTESGEQRVLVGLRESPFVVKRRPLAGEEWTQGRPPPPPNQSPFGVRGRLLSADAAERYRPALKDFVAWGELVPHRGALWVIAEGERPRRDVGLLLIVGALTAFFLLNAYLFARDVRFRLSRRRAAIAPRLDEPR